MAKAPLTASQFKQDVAEISGVSKSDVDKVLKATKQVAGEELRDVGEVKIPDITKLKVTRRAATKARKGVNPFTGEPTTFKAKPARNVVKARPLAGVKGYV